LSPLRFLSPSYTGNELSRLNSASSDNLQALTTRGESRVAEPKEGILPKNTTDTLQDAHQQETSITMRKLQEALALPPWQRMAANIECQQCFNPYGTTIQIMRRFPERFMLCPSEPSSFDFLVGGSANELANIIYIATSYMRTARPEQLAMNITNYSILRVRLQLLRKVILVAC
jgi:hypothetical protein